MLIGVIKHLLPSQALKYTTHLHSRMFVIGDASANLCVKSEDGVSFHVSVFILFLFPDSDDVRHASRGPINKQYFSLFISETGRHAIKFNLKMKDGLSGGGWLCSRGGGGFQLVRLGERSDAAMLHVLDNPISPVINHAQ